MQPLVHLRINDLHFLDTAAFTAQHLLSPPELNHPLFEDLMEDTMGLQNLCINRRLLLERTPDQSPTIQQGQRTILANQRSKRLLRCSYMVPKDLLGVQRMAI
jgi:hypothetical protein